MTDPNAARPGTAADDYSWLDTATWEYDRVSRRLLVIDREGKPLGIAAEYVVPWFGNRLHGTPAQQATAARLAAAERLLERSRHIFVGLGVVPANVEEIDAFLSARDATPAHGTPPDPAGALDPFVVCGIDGCEFAVERGEGRTMALHQSEDHAAPESEGSTR